DGIVDWSVPWSSVVCSSDLFPSVAPIFALPQRGAECLAGFGGAAALRDGFLDVRLEFFVDLAAQTLAAKHISDARPKRHITPSSDFIIYRRLSIRPVRWKSRRVASD